MPCALIRRRVGVASTQPGSQLHGLSGANKSEVRKRAMRRYKTNAGVRLGLRVRRAMRQMSKNTGLEGKGEGRVLRSLARRPTLIARVCSTASPVARGRCYRFRSYSTWRSEEHWPTVDEGRRRRTCRLELARRTPKDLWTRLLTWERGWMARRGLGCSLSRSETEGVRGCWDQHDASRTRKATDEMLTHSCTQNPSVHGLKGPAVADKGVDVI